MEWEQKQHKFAPIHKRHTNRHTDTEKITLISKNCTTRRPQRLTINVRRGNFQSIQTICAKCTIMDYYFFGKRKKINKTKVNRNDASSSSSTELKAKKRRQNNGEGFFLLPEMKKLFIFYVCLTFTSSRCSFRCT